MKNTESKIVKIAEPKGQTTLSRGQKLFNRLIKKIEKERKNLAAWQAAIPVYQQKCSDELDPLVRSFDQQRTELVRLFDAVYADKIFTKNEKAKLGDIICTLTEQMVAEGHNPDAEQLLKQLYNKYSGSDYDAELEEETALMKTMMEGALGVELGEDADFNSPEKLIAQIHAQMQKKFEQEAQEQEAAEERKSKRKKSAKTLAREARQQEEEKNVSQSIREVFRKLASALHPDREPDELERKRKTALMQRVNVAYAKQDLLGLLELQLEVEQIDQSMINTISEERLKHFNAILSEQSAELEQEVMEVEMSFRMRFGANIPEDAILYPQFITHHLQRQIDGMQQDIASIKSDLLAFQNNKNIKTMLKTYRVQSAPSYEPDMFGDIDFGRMDF